MTIDFASERKLSEFTHQTERRDFPQIQTIHGITILAQIFMSMLQLHVAATCQDILQVCHACNRHKELLRGRHAK